MQSSDSVMQGLPRPGKGLTGLMLAITAIWLTFAIGLNWGGASSSLFLALAGDTHAILHGEVWRLLTAPLLNDPVGGSGVWSLFLTVAGLFFLGASLEKRWGTSRLLRFILLTSVLAYVFQMLVALVLPASVAARLVGDVWYGMGPALDAMAIAWAFTFKGQTIRLFMVVPVTTRTLVAFTIGWALFRLAAAAAPPEGLLSPFGGMAFGWLLGGDTPSPLRRAWLKLRLAQLDGEARREGARRKRPNSAGLRVLPGGRVDEDDKGPDGRWLN
jgi:membrane associated rhomboid family serine protease